MTTEVHILTEAQARRRLLTSLALPAKSTARTVYREVVRSVLWASTRDGAPIGEPALVERVSGPASLVSAPGTGGEPTRLRAELSAMVVAGEAAEVSQGLWTVPPPAVVAMPGGRRLLSSGIPASALPDAERRRVEFEGALRFTTARTAAPEVRFEDWARPPLFSLRDWSDRTLAKDPDHTWISAPFGAVEVYVPRATPSAPGKWVGSANSTGRHLCRVRSIDDQPLALLADLRGGVIDTCRPVTGDEALRLQFGLDARAGTMRFRARGAKGHTVIDLPPLPALVVRQLLPWLVDGSDQSRVQDNPIVRDVLAQLSIDVTDC